MFSLITVYKYTTCVSHKRLINQEFWLVELWDLTSRKDTNFAAKKKEKNTRRPTKEIVLNALLLHFYHLWFLIQNVSKLNTIDLWNWEQKEDTLHFWTIHRKEYVFQHLSGCIGIGCLVSVVRPPQNQLFLLFPCKNSDYICCHIISPLS